MSSKHTIPARHGRRRVGLRTAVVTAAVGAAVALPAVAAVAAPAHGGAASPASSSAPKAAASGAQAASSAPMAVTAASTQKAVKAKSGVRTVTMANGDRLTFDPRTATAAVEDPQGSVIGVLDIDKPGPVRSETAGKGHTWTYTMDQAMSTATVTVKHDGKTQHYSFLKRAERG